MSKRKHKPWVMPAWMEPYRDTIVNTGGNAVEDLMNDHDTNFNNNLPRCALMLCVQSQVALLSAMRERGFLSAPK